MAVQISGNDITVPRDGSFTRNVTIGGTLTYEDVTNIDSVGLVTARNGIEIGARPGVAASISVDGNMIVSGISTFGGNVNLGDGTKLGIGGSPDVDLHIKSTAPTIRFTDTDTSRFSQIYAIDGNLRFDADNNNAQADTNIIFRTDNTERLRIDSSGRLLLGTTTEGVANASTFTIAGAVHCGMTIRSGTSNDGQIAFSDGTSGDDEYRGQILYRHSSDHMHFVTNASERVRIFSNGDIGVNATTVNRADAGRNTIQFDYSGSDGSEGLEIRLSNSALNGNAATDNAAITYIGQNLGITNRENGVITFRNNGSERMRIDANGKIGVNITPDNDAGLVQIQGTHAIASGPTNLLGTASKAAFRIKSTNDATMSMYFGVTDDSIGNMPYIQVGNYNGGSGGATAAYKLFLNPFSDGSNESGVVFGGTNATTTNGSVGAMRYKFFTNANNLNIGLETPTADRSAIFERRRTGRTSPRLAQIALYENSSNEGGVLVYSSGANADVSGGVYIVGGGTGWSAMSDIRLKDKIGDITNALEDITKIETMKFTWKNDESKKHHVGVTAQSVESVVPESIERGKDHVMADQGDKTEYMSVRYTELIPLCIEAIKELSAEVKQLKSQLNN